MKIQCPFCLRTVQANSNRQKFCRPCSKEYQRFVKDELSKERNRRHSRDKTIRSSSQKRERKLPEATAKPIQDAATQETVKKPRIDWEEIREGWDSGLSIRELGDKHGVSSVHIYSHAKINSWRRRIQRKPVEPTANKTERPITRKTAIKLFTLGLGRTLKDSSLVEAGLSNSEIQDLRRKYPDNLDEEIPSSGCGCSIFSGELTQNCGRSYALRG